METFLFAHECAHAQLEDSNDDVRTSAAWTLGTLWSDGADALPMLEHLTKDPAEVVAVTAQLAVAMIAGDCQSVVRALEHRREDVREKAAWAIARFRPNVNIAIPVLRKMIEEVDPRLRREAAVALVALVGNDADAMAVLRGSLHDSDASVRRWAASALGERGADLEGMIEALQQAIDDEDSDVRLSAATSLAEILQRTPEGFSTWIEILEHTHDDVSERAAEELATLLEMAAHSIPFVIRMLGASRPHIRQSVMSAIGNLCAALRTQSSASGIATDACGGSEDFGAAKDQLHGDWFDETFLDMSAGDADPTVRVAAFEALF